MDVEDLLKMEKRDAVLGGVIMMNHAKEAYSKTSAQRCLLADNFK